MSTSTSEYYTFISQQIMIYFGVAILIAGLTGDVFSLIGFLSLKTFQDNACTFYLTVMWAVDIGQLLTGLLSRIMISGFNIDWTLSSIPYCKFRVYCYQFCAGTSIVCLCLAAVNHFLASSSNLRLQRWSDKKIAHHIIILVAFLWLLHGIPFLVYYDHIQSPSTGNLTCTSSNAILLQYFNNGFVPVLLGFLPFIITGVFALLAYHNRKQPDRRVLPTVHLELDKQLTAIVLIQFIYHTILTIPYLIGTILTEDAVLKKDSITATKLEIASSLAWCMYYLNYAVS